jgi:hypothetical protein
MQSKLSRNSSSRVSGSSGLKIHHNKIMEKETLTHRMKDISKEGQPQEIQSKTQEKKGNKKSKKDTGKWCEFHKIPWHNTDECHSKQSLVVELKEKESEPDLDFDSKHNKGKQIIDAEPTATIMATTIQPEEPEELEEGEHLFHSQMWVKGTPLHFIVDSGSQKNLISVEVVKRLKLPMMPHPQPYTIRWLSRG